MKKQLPVYDKRNPKYYEPRAGYPLPDADWYRNTDPKTGKHVAMNFSKEKFAQGFNLTPGKYYKIREHLVHLLRQDNLYLKDLQKDSDAKFLAWSVWEEIMEHPLLQHDAPLKWRHDMVWRFISATSSWIQRHLEALDNGEIPDKGWEWGPERLTPKNAPPHIQYQHLKIRVENKEAKPRIVKVLSLLDGNEDAVPHSPIDLNPEDLRIHNLFDILRETDGFGGFYSVVWVDGDDDLFVLNEDIDLVTALSRFQVEGPRDDGDIDEVIMSVV